MDEKRKSGGRALVWLSWLAGLAFCAAMGYAGLAMWLEGKLTEESLAAGWKIDQAYSKAHPGAGTQDRLPGLHVEQWALAEVPDLFHIWARGSARAGHMKARAQKGASIAFAVFALYAVLAGAFSAAASPTLSRTRSQRAGTVCLFLSAVPLAVYFVRNLDGILRTRRIMRSPEAVAFAGLAGLALLLLSGIPHRVCSWIAGGDGKE